MAADLSQYEKMGKLGQGTYGTVYFARDKQTNEYVAMKKLLINSDEEGIPSTAIREISLLKELSDHPNIVRLKDVLYVDKKLYLIFEYLDQDLRQYLDSVKGLLESTEIKSYMYQLLKGILYCHSNRVLHRDLKPQNLLLDRYGRLKLCDFNLSRLYGISTRPFTQEVVTLWYRAPEILLGQTLYSTPVDMWSVGCIFAEMVSKLPLFPGDSEIDQLYRMFRTLGTPNETIWAGVSQLPHYQATFPQFNAQSLSKLFPRLEPEGIDLLEKMLQYEPSKRISAKSALNHPYFNSLHTQNQSPQMTSTTSKQTLCEPLC